MSFTEFERDAFYFCVFCAAIEGDEMTVKQRTVPFFDYPALFERQKKEIMSCLEDVLGRGAYILQRDLEEFEENIKKLIGVKHVSGVADGTNALILALRAAGIGPGDEVILASHTYIATAASVHFVGGTPVLVECGADHMIDSESVERAVTKKTRVIMPTQLNGRTCDMDALQAIADKHGLIIIEDAAQALSSMYKGKCAGTFGLAGTFSFYPAKVLGCFGVGTIIQWGGKAVHQFKGLGFEDVNLPITEKMTSRFLMLPMHTALTDEDVGYVCDCIIEFYSADYAD